MKFSYILLVSQNVKRVNQLILDAEDKLWGQRDKLRNELASLQEFRGNVELLLGLKIKLFLISSLSGNKIFSR